MKSNLTTLSNGVRVLCLNIPDMSSVTVSASVRVGSRNETEIQNGISHFIEHMAFKGTTKKDAYTIMRDIEHVGANINAYTSDSETVYHANGKAADLAHFVEFIGNIILTSTLPLDEIEKERNVILQEHTMYHDDPASIAYELFNSVAYPDQPHGRSTIGTTDNIKAFQRDDMRSYIDQYYTGENIIVAAVGNVNEEEFIKLVSATFGQMPQGTTTAVNPTYYVGGVAVKEGKFDQTVMLIGFPLDNMYSSTKAADNLAASVLGGGMSSPLFTEIRENRGLVYGVSAGADIDETTGMCYIRAATTPENFEEYIKAVSALLKEHVLNINTFDFERAKNRKIADIMRLSESPASLMRSAISNVFTRGRVIALEEILDEYNAVTIDDIRASIATMLTKTPTMSMCGIGADKKYYDLLIDCLKQ